MDAPPALLLPPPLSANPLANSLCCLLFFFLSTDCGTDCNCNCTINHFHLRYKLHRRISVRVLATCCQMLKSPLSFFLALSLSWCRCIFQINSDPPAYTRHSHPFRCRVEVHATPTMRSLCPATSLFHPSSLIYGPASNIIMLYPKYSSARKLRPCIFETSNRFSSTYFSSFEKLSLFVHWPRVATQCNSVSVEANLIKLGVGVDDKQTIRYVMESPKSNDYRLHEIESVLSSRLHLSGLYYIRYYSILIKFKLPKEKQKEMCCDLWDQLALH